MILNILSNTEKSPIKTLAEQIGKWSVINVIDNINTLVVNAVDEYVIDSDNPMERERYYNYVKEKSGKFATLIHPESYIDKYANIEDGCVIYKGVVIRGDTNIGANVVLKTYVTVSHDSTIGNHSVICEKSTIGGFSHIGDNASIGFGSVFRDYSQIGNRCIVEIGSVVMNDFGDDKYISGYPARIKNQNKD